SSAVMSASSVAGSDLRMKSTQVRILCGEVLDLSPGESWLENRANACHTRRRVISVGAAACEEFCEKRARNARILRRF
ncbi:MAG: hypothetical protein VB141_13595, partial [Burkholderia gladioli]